jgi:acyl-CoA thioesterase-2
VSYFELNELIENLLVQQQDELTFTGNTLAGGLPRIFGGQVLAQAMYAATQTIDDEKTVHSQHAYFLRPGDPAKEITFEVEVVRDGRSFAARRVVVSQEGKVIFNTSLSFQAPEKGLEHQSDIIIPALPSESENELEYLHQRELAQPGCTKNYLNCFKAIDVRPCQRRNAVNLTAGKPAQSVWFKANGDLPKVKGVNEILLAYISDMRLMGTSLRAHPVDFHTPHFQGASLDHGLWIHRDFNVNEWLYCVMDGPVSANSRGFNRSSFYTKEGVMVASAVQEGLIRFTPPINESTF